MEIGENVRRFLDSEFDQSEELGEGIDAFVNKAIHQELGIVAIKTYKQKTDKKEISLLLKIEKFDYIVRLFGFLTRPNGSISGCVLEYMPNRSLRDVIYNNEKKYSERCIYSWIESSANGLEYLHGINIIHRDIKPANLLIGHSLYDLKIADFCDSRELSLEILSGSVGTIAYMAPEVMSGGGRQGEYDASADIYSLCVSIVEMANRASPWAHLEEAGIAPPWIKLMCYVQQNKRPKLKKYLNPELVELIKRGWDCNRKLRPTPGVLARTAAKLFRLPLIKSVPKSKNKRIIRSINYEEKNYLRSIREIEDSLENFLLKHFNLLDEDEFNQQIANLKLFCDQLDKSLLICKMLALGKLPLEYNFLLDMIPNYSKEGTRLFELEFVESTLFLLSHSMKNYSLGKETPLLPKNIVNLCVEKRKEKERPFFKRGIHRTIDLNSSRKNVLLVGENQIILDRLWSSALNGYRKRKDLLPSDFIYEFCVHTSFKIFAPTMPFEAAKRTLWTAARELGNVFTICFIAELSSDPPWYLDLIKICPENNVLVVLSYRSKSVWINKASTLKNKFPRIRCKFYNNENLWSPLAVCFLEEKKRLQNAWSDHFSFNLITDILSHMRHFQTRLLQ